MLAHQFCMGGEEVAGALLQGTRRGRAPALPRDEKGTTARDEKEGNPFEESVF